MNKSRWMHLTQSRKHGKLEMKKHLEVAKPTNRENQKKQGRQDPAGKLQYRPDVGVDSRLEDQDGAKTDSNKAT